jgi:hypothetical protein
MVEVNFIFVINFILGSLTRKYRLGWAFKDFQSMKDEAEPVFPQRKLNQKFEVKE